MKTFIAMIAVFVMAIPAWADPDAYDVESEIMPVGKCPKTMIVGDVNDCLRCHTAPSFKLQEASPDEGREYGGVFDASGHELRCRDIIPAARKGAG